MTATDPSPADETPEVTVFEQDGGDLPLGPISPAASAFGEYHTHPTPPGVGSWGDAVMSTGQKGPPWSVVLDGDEPVFEAGQPMRTRPAILVLDGVPHLLALDVIGDVAPAVADVDADFSVAHRFTLSTWAAASAAAAPECRMVSGMSMAAADEPATYTPSMLVRAGLWSSSISLT